LRVFATIIDPNGKKRTFPVKAIDTIIGRSAKATVTLKDEICSGLHAKIYLEGDCIFIEDLKSKNGVFLNEIKVLKQRLYIGDEVRIGKSFLKIEDTKMNNEDIEAHTSSSNNRKGGSITLEIETFKEAKERSRSSRAQKDYLKDAKLYDGVEKDAKREKFSAKKLAMLDKIAMIIDLTLTLAFFFGPYIFLYTQSPKAIKDILSDPSNIIVGENLFYSIAAIVLGAGFLKWNRSSGNSSIGEKVCGL